MTQFTPLSEPAYDAQQADAERHDTERDELGPKARSPAERLELILELAENDLISREAAWELVGGVGDVPEGFMVRPVEEPALMDKLLAAGWHVMGASYALPRANIKGARECRVVLVNKAVGRKLFGFGATFEEAFDSAAGQV